MDNTREPRRVQLPGVCFNNQGLGVSFKNKSANNTATVQDIDLALIKRDRSNDKKYNNKKCMYARAHAFEGRIHM